jgi:hypothetical protein
MYIVHLPLDAGKIPPKPTWHCQLVEEVFRAIGNTLSVFLGIPSSFPLRVTSRILKIRRNIKNIAVNPSVYISVHIQR